MSPRVTVSDKFVATNWLVTQTIRETLINFTRKILHVRNYPHTIRPRDFNDTTQHTRTAITFKSLSFQNISNYNVHFYGYFLTQRTFVCRQNLTRISHLQRFV